MNPWPVLAVLLNGLLWAAVIVGLIVVGGVVQ